MVANWPQLPNGLILGQVTGVDVDSRGNVFVFHRAERVWNGEPIWTHTIAVGPDGALYVGEVGIGMRIQKFVR